MKIINRYIIEDSKMPIIFGISLFTFIFLIEIIVSMMENIIVKGISLIDVLRILSFYLPPILTQTIPMGLFLGIMITFAKFTKTSEITAMSSMGMSLNTILKPIVTLAIAITIGIYFLQEVIIPRSFIKLQEVTQRIVLENPVFQLKERILLNDLGEYAIYVDNVVGQTSVAENILIFQKKKGIGYPTVVLGEKAYWKNTNIVLESSNFYDINKDGGLELSGDFSEKKIPLTSYFEDIEIDMKDIEAMNIKTLLENMKNKTAEEKIPYLVEINRKIAIPLSTIVLGILGILLSVGHHRSSNGASFGISLGVIFIYIVVLNIGMVFANKGVISPYVGIWGPNAMLTLGTYLLYRVKVGGKR